MTDYREAFHNDLKAFLKNLCKTFDDDRELMMITTSLLIALSDDPHNDVVKQFSATVSPHVDLIARKDPQFFYNVHISGSEYKLMSKIHLYWEQLTAVDQQVVWDYIQVLVYLSGKILV